MLRTILSITGKPGLYKLISQGKNLLIVEDLINGKRMPLHSRDRVVSLGDIAMYTESEDRPLGDILDAVFAFKNGEKIDIKAIDGNDGLRELFGEIIPDYDRDRVYPSDIRKLFTWYNLLRDAGFEKFAEEEKGEEETAETEQEK
ncbi:MAG: DUF5606 domain-containing protein [Muribaculaceae bacterium]|nr:DUF5606 domain-containing protein [Muribaculaceae bacterium]